MFPARFSRYVLRTTDVEFAKSFYGAVLDSTGDGIVALHESAIARGARPHWLGLIQAGGLGGAEAVAARFVARGARRLGPPSGVGDFVVLKDPGGAIVAVDHTPAESAAGVVWHQLNTRDPETAATNYADLFGWSVTAPLDLGAFGRHRRFAFGPGEPAAGMISDVAGRAEVHTHWLFFFAVPSLDLAIVRVRTLGGLVIGPFRLPNGARVAACDDAQGAAFGIIEPEDALLLTGELP